MNHSALTDTYIVLDLETTGLSPTKCEIIEIAMIKVVHGRPTETFQALVKPSSPIPPFITQLTGITNQDVETAEPISVVADYALAFMEDLPITGWNVGFDIKFLKRALPGHPFSWFDTLPLARKHFPGLESYKLSAVAAHLDCRKGTHRALDDCIAAMDIYEYIRNRKGDSHGNKL